MPGRHAPRGALPDAATGGAPDPAERLPLFLDLRGRAVLVVGGGPVGTRRAERMLRAGALVTVVAPVVTGRLHDLSAAGALTWLARTFHPGDLAGCWLVHAATGVPDADAQVVRVAEAARVWASVASDRAAGTAWPAAETSDVDGIRVAVTAGGDPGRATAVRDRISAGLRDGSLLRRRRRPGGGGRVWLVGAGPGDPDLLTVRARRVLQLADVVVVDHLAPAGVLAGLDPDIEVVDAGKLPGRHAMSQDEIQRLVVDRARRGRRVVRLKGGDPFVLGRGGEEALACVRAGIPVEVVPGVPSAVAVPAAAGIPVTHRGITSSFVLLSGHAGLPRLLSDVAAAPPEATLVILMATRRLAEIAAALQAAGRDPGTPAAVVESGWTHRQRVVVSTLAEVAGATARARVSSPAVVVVGEVVRLREVLGDLATPSRDAGHGTPATAGGRRRRPDPRAG